MKIVIRTRYINTFLVGFKSFKILYPERIKDLIVQVQGESDTNIEAYKTVARLFGFTVVVVPPGTSIHGNDWANMIYLSLQYDEVVSLDDDIVFLRPGFFERLEEIQKYTDAKILGAWYRTDNSMQNLLHSHMVYSKGATITPDDFSTMEKALQKYEGADTAILSINHEKEIFYIDDLIPYYRNLGFKSYCHCEYYVHVGGVSIDWHATYNAMTHPGGTTGGPDLSYK